MSFNYTAGLNNMGSFQVSGRPWLKNVTGLADGGTQYVTFPNVTKKITVKNHSGSGALKIGFADNARRAFDMPGGNNHLETSFTNTSAFTIAFWIKPTSLTVSRVLQLGLLGQDTRLQGHSSFGAIKLFVNGNAEFSSDNMTAADTWVHIAVVINDTNNKVYVNGSEEITNTEAAGAYDFLSIGADVSNFDDIYDEMYLFNSAFSPEEISELYADGDYFDPRDHSQAANLVSWWAFEDNNYRDYFATDDTTSTINDRIGSNNLTQPGSGGNFVPGRQLDTAINSHSITIPAGEELELNVKTKSMFLFADGAAQDFDIYASLTNLPSERMYDLTGPGIDE